MLNDFQDASSNGDEWINFEEFCQGVASLLDAPLQQQQPQQQQLQLQQQHQQNRLQQQQRKQPPTPEQSEDTFDLHNSCKDEGNQIITLNI